MSKLIIQVDMDGVLADFEYAVFKKVFELNRADLPPIHPWHRQGRGTANDYADRYGKWAKNLIWSIVGTEGFFRDLEPIAGGIESCKDLLKMGVDVRICTAPVISSSWCVAEKYLWIKKHLGNSWAERITIASDKTLVRGNYLIDDKAKITGALVPEWTQILFYSNGQRKEYENWTGLKMLNWHSGNTANLFETILQNHV